MRPTLELDMRRAAIVVAAICLLVSCGGSDTGGTGGAGGGSATGGSAGANAGAGGAAGGRSGASGGRGGTTGTAGSGGGQASCPACFACVNANCSAGITTCQANADCNAVYQCAGACTMSVQSCVEMNGGFIVALAFANAVSSCINGSCQSVCANILTP
jgi:hypothetical protein